MLQSDDEKTVEVHDKISEMSRKSVERVTALTNELEFVRNDLFTKTNELMRAQKAIQDSHMRYFDMQQENMRLKNGGSKRMPKPASVAEMRLRSKTSSSDNTSLNLDDDDDDQ